MLVVKRYPVGDSWLMPTGSRIVAVRELGPARYEPTVLQPVSPESALEVDRVTAAIVARDSSLDALPGQILYAVRASHEHVLVVVKSPTAKVVQSPLSVVDHLETAVPADSIVVKRLLIETLIGFVRRATGEIVNRQTQKLIEQDLAALLKEHGIKP